MRSELATKCKGSTVNVSPCDKETCETMLRDSCSDGSSVCPRCKLNTFQMKTKCNPLKLRLKKLKLTSQREKNVLHSQAVFSESETEPSCDNTLQKRCKMFSPCQHMYNVTMVDGTRKNIKEGNDDWKKLASQHRGATKTKNRSVLTCCLHNTRQSKKACKSNIQWTSESESSTCKSTKRSDGRGVDIFVCRPYDNHETHFYKRIQGFVTKREEERPAQIQCRYLTLPCDLDPYVPLAKQALTVKYLNQLPALIRKIPLIQKTLLTLEFFRAVPGDFSRAPCEARVFIPSGTLLLLLRSKHTALHSKYKVLMHLLKPCSEDASVVILEIPLSLFSAELQPPQSLQLSNKRLLYAAKRVANGYVDKKLTALLRFQYQTMINSFQKLPTQRSNKIYSIACNLESVTSDTDDFAFESDSFAYKVESESFDEELESISSKTCSFRWKKKDDVFSRRGIKKENTGCVKKDKVLLQSCINGLVCDGESKPTLKWSTWSCFVWMLTSGWQFLFTSLRMVPMAFLYSVTCLKFGKTK